VAEVAPAVEVEHAAPESVVADVPIAPGVPDEAEASVVDFEEFDDEGWVSVHSLVYRPPAEAEPPLRSLAGESATPRAEAAEDSADDPDDDPSGHP